MVIPVLSLGFKLLLGLCCFLSVSKKKNLALSCGKGAMIYFASHIDLREILDKRIKINNTPLNSTFIAKDDISEFKKHFLQNNHIPMP